MVIVDQMQHLEPVLTPNPSLTSDNHKGEPGEEQTSWNHLESILGAKCGGCADSDTLVIPAMLTLNDTSKNNMRPAWCAGVFSNPPDVLLYGTRKSSPTAR